MKNPIEKYNCSTFNLFPKTTDFIFLNSNNIGGIKKDKTEDNFGTLLKRYLEQKIKNEEK